MSSARSRIVIENDQQDIKFALNKIRHKAVPLIAAYSYILKSLVRQYFKNERGTP